MRLREYPADVERQMVALYGSLSEKDRRRYAAIEALKLGHGGVQMLPNFSIVTLTPSTAAARISIPCHRMTPRDVSEKKGDRKKVSIAEPELLTAVEAIVENHTAGSPVDENMLWLFLNTLHTLRSVERLVAFYIQEHNTRLPHSTFDGQTLDEMYFGTGASVPAEQGT